MRSYQTWTLACVAAAVLSACTTLDTQHPDKMYRQAILNNLQQDNQYNFSGEATLVWQDKSASAVAASALPASEVTEADAAVEEVDAAAMATAAAMAAADAAAVDAAAQAAYEAAADEDDDVYAGMNEDWSELLEEILLGAEKYPVVSSFMKHSAVKLDGAMDLKQGIVEINPAIKLGTANYGGWAQLPIHIDGKQERVLVDVQGYASWMQEAMQGRESRASAETLGLIQRLEDGSTLLELKAPADASMRYPIQTAFKAIPKGLEEYLNAMDAKHFVLAPMDDYGRSLGAAHRVQLDYGMADSMKWSAAFLKAYNSEFERLHKEAPEAGVTDEAYDSVKSVLLLSGMLFGMTDPSSESCQESEEAMTLCLEKQKELEQELGNMPKMQHSLYLNRSGRVLGIKDAMVLQHPKAHKDLVYQSHIKMSHYGRPQFQMGVNKRATVSIWDLLESKKTISDLDVDLED